MFVSSRSEKDDVAATIEAIGPQVNSCMISALLSLALYLRRYANIASPRANQLLALVLFEGMANPACRTSKS
jgi:hypothetical protein